MTKKKFAGLVIPAGVVLAAFIGGMKRCNKKIIAERKLKERYELYYNLTNQWLQNRYNNYDISKYFAERGILTVAVYGNGTMANLLYQELMEYKIEVLYFIDKNSPDGQIGFNNLRIVNMDNLNSMKRVDAVIVTPFFDFEEINQQLLKREIADHIISLEDIIFDI